METVELVKRAGVVGAGGAGFPTHVKLDAKVDLVIVNGAECEPLLQVDQLLMCDYSEKLISGIELVMEAVSASKAIVATKKAYTAVVEALGKAISGKPEISLHLLDSYYPSGDEKTLIHEITGKVVPSDTLPKDMGCIVINVGTVINVFDAVNERPVTEKQFTIGGDVENPTTVWAPVGMSIREVLKKAEVDVDEEEYSLIIGGPCMGKLENDWDSSITKTTGGLLFFKNSHPIIGKRTMPISRQVQLALAVCCQCNMCTQMCPRNALGLKVEPHKAMRAMANADASLIGDANGLLACCSCGLCTDYACHMNLTPASIMDMFKTELGKQGLRPKKEEHELVANSPMPNIATKRLVARMGIAGFVKPAPWHREKLATSTVRIMLSMHIGRPSEPIVSLNQRVRREELIAKIPENSLGANIHASIDGVVTAINSEYIEIKQ